jgi:hypothetical protein
MKKLSAANKALAVLNKELAVYIEQIKSREKIRY